MQIFYVDEDPVTAAQNMVDKHVIKQILESAQLMSTAHRVLDGEKKEKAYILHDGREPHLYKTTHINHPSAKWVRESVENYNWLVDHFFALMTEYNFRYGKTHKCYGELSYLLSSPPKNLKEFDWTTPPSCMPDEYIISQNPLTNYRNYYKLGKSDLHSWKKREPPEWINKKE